VNNKGGVGKTTVAVNLAHALTRRGQRVLVIDTDSQCNATSILCSKDAGKNTLYEVFAESDINIEHCIYPTEYEKLGSFHETTKVVNSLRVSTAGITR
jgi:cellulose biosynthesis protein BcsQ